MIKSAPNYTAKQSEESAKNIIIIITKVQITVTLHKTLQGHFTYNVAWFVLSVNGRR